MVQAVVECGKVHPYRMCDECPHRSHRIASASGEQQKEQQQMSDACMLSFGQQNLSSYFTEGRLWYHSIFRFLWGTFCSIMGILSNRCSEIQLIPGDHIYTWRAAYTYSHHGMARDSQTVVFQMTTVCMSLHGVLSYSDKNRRHL